MSYRQLHPFAETVHATPIEPGLCLDALECRFELVLNSGAVVGCTVTTPTPRGGFSSGSLELVLRAETPLDRSDKSSGQTVEAQVGDPDFDQAIFIDGNVAHHEVRRILHQPGVRRAARALVDGNGTVLFAAGQVTAKYLLKQRADLFEPDTLKAIARDLVTLASAGAPRGEPLEAHGARLWKGLLAALALSVVGLIVASDSAPISFLVGLLWWMTAATFTAFAARPLLRRLTAGDAGSGQRSRLMVACAFLTGGFGGAASLVALNAALDAAPDRVERGVVVQQASHDDDDGRYRTDIQWESGEPETVHLHGRYAPLEPIVRRSHPGRFTPWGIRWGSH